VRTRVQFYREVLAALAGSDIPFLIGGAFAFCRHAGIDLRTKDLDLMIEQRTWPALARVLRNRGIYATLKFPHWLGKALSPDGQVDVIFNSGAGVSPVDASWFTHGVGATVLGHRVKLCGVEDLIWSKAFVMERERFDGADVLHLIRARADGMDWERLRHHFRGHEAVLLAHLILFRYVYPSERHRIPSWLTRDLSQTEARTVRGRKVCRGTYLSRAQYLVDVEQWGYADARLPPFGDMSRRHLQLWTNAIDTQRSRVRERRGRPSPPRRRMIA
jgi:hypothetical protein